MTIGAASIIGIIGAVMPFSTTKQMFASDNTHYDTLAVAMLAVDHTRAVAPGEPVEPVRGLRRC